MLSDIGEPQLIWTICGEVTQHQIIMDRRTRPDGIAARLTLTEHAEPLVVMTDSPRRPIRHGLAGSVGFVSQQPVSKLRVIPVSVKERIGTISCLQISLGQWLVQTAVIGWTSKLQHP